MRTVISAVIVAALIVLGAQHPSAYGALIGYWNLNEGTGTIANDTSGNNNDGALNNGPVWVTGKTGAATDKALKFDGVDDQVTVSDPASGALDFGTASFSYALWLKLETVGTGGARVWGVRPASSVGLAWFDDLSLTRE